MAKRLHALGFALLLAPMAGRSTWATPPAVTRSELRGQLSSARQLVAACSAQASACSSGTLPGTEQVAADGSSEKFLMSWQWLAEALDKAGKAPRAERLPTLEAADDRLSELATQLNTPGDDQGEKAAFPSTRAAADRVLAGDDFRADAGPTWLDRGMARVQDWLFRLLLGLGRVGTGNPWIAPLLEWFCFASAAGGLLLFVRRSLQRHAVRLALGEGAAHASPAGLWSTDWTARAAEAEAAGAWREAIHCLYWAAVAALEARKAWRPNPTRTPREYLRLLRPGSPAQGALAALTGLFERTWYGSAQPAAALVEAARQELTRLREADLQVKPDPGPRAASPGATGGAPA